MEIKRGSDLESLLMLCALADRNDVRDWMVGMQKRKTCPLCSAVNTMLDTNYGETAGWAFMDLTDLWTPELNMAIVDITKAADGTKFYREDVREALLAMHGLAP